MPKLSLAESKKVINILLELYPDAGPELEFTNPFELLVATILSAQCTDVRVNKVTRELFKELKTPYDFIEIGEEELAQRIKSCGLYRNKAKNILGSCIILHEKYNGMVPDKFEEILNLPGVGRKTANVVASNAFNIPGIAVDTHVFRVSNRIKLIDADNVYDTEMQLRKLLDKDIWTKMHHVLILHGRYVCKARKPKCDECMINELCFYNRFKS